MCNIQIHSGISRILNVFYLCGMWHNGNENVFRAFIRKSAFRLWSTSLAVSYASEAFQNPDISAAIYSGVCAVIASVLIVKLENILNKKKEINEFLRQLCVHNFSTNDASFKQTEEKLNQFMKLVNIFLVLIALGIFSLLIAPIFTTEKNLPIYVWLPLSWKNTQIGYCISYVYLVSTMSYSMIPISFTAIIWYIMLNCSIKYELLENELRNIDATITDIQQQQLETEKQQKYYQKLIFLIESHRNIRE